MHRIKAGQTMTAFHRKGETVLLFCSLALFSASLAAQSDQETAWAVLQSGISEKSTDLRAAAVGALRLIPNNPKAICWPKKLLRIRRRRYVWRRPPL
jgi:hypothetical protein